HLSQVSGCQESETGGRGNRTSRSERCIEWQRDHPTRQQAARTCNGRKGERKGTERVIARHRLRQSCSQEWTGGPAASLDSRYCPCAEQHSSQLSDGGYGRRGSGYYGLRQWRRER